MTKNRFANRSKIMGRNTRELIRLFVVDLEVIRIRVAEFCEAQSPLSDEIEVD